MATEYPPMTPEERALFARVGTPRATDDDLIAAATSEADHALRSLPPHCLPTDGGLPHNEDHANACAHRCWSFLRELVDRRSKSRCTCAAIQSADKSRHFRGCPLRIEHPKECEFCGGEHDARDCGNK